MEKKPITQTLELIALVASLGLAVQQARADGKVNALDLGILMRLIPQVGPALDGADQIPGELADLDEDEQAQLLGQISKDLDIVIDDPRLKEIAGASLEVGAKLLDLWRAFDPNALG